MYDDQGANKKDIPGRRRENESREEVIFKTVALTLKHKFDLYIPWK